MLRSRNPLRYLLVLTCVGWGGVVHPLAAQFGSVITSPPLNPNEPAVLGRASTRIGERVAPRRWRERYNVYELTALIWQLYHVTREGADWEGIFTQLSGALDAETALHRAHYAGLRSGGEVVRQYAAVADLLADLRAVVAYGLAIGRALEDPVIWSDGEEAARILRASREIRTRASRTLDFLPHIVGDPATADPAAARTATETYWATPADRLRQLDRMATEVHALRTDLGRLYGQVARVDAARRTLYLDQAAAQTLLLPSR